jgi:hypothetical protein
MEPRCTERCRLLALNEHDIVAAAAQAEVRLHFVSGLEKGVRKVPKLACTTGRVLFHGFEALATTHGIPEAKGLKWTGPQCEETAGALQHRYLQPNLKLKAPLDEASKQYHIDVDQTISPVIYNLNGGQLYLLEVQPKQIGKSDRQASSGAQSSGPRKRQRPASSASAAAASFLASVREKRHQDVDAMLKVTPGLLSETDRFGYSALHIAAKVPSNLDVITCLVTTHSMNVNSRYKNGSTPLHAAAFSEDKQNVECLLKCGADPFSTTESLWQPVHNAANGRKQPAGDAANRLEVVRVLMDSMAESGSDNRQLQSAPRLSARYCVDQTTAEKYPTLVSKQEGPEFADYGLGLLSESDSLFALSPSLGPIPLQGGRPLEGGGDWLPGLGLL